MQLTRYHLFLLGGLFLIIMGPLAFTQPGPGGGKKGKFDPDKMKEFTAKQFDNLSGGKDSFDVKTVQLQSWGRGPTPEQQKEQMMAFLQKKGVTNGIMTKPLFVEHSEERMKEMQAKWGDKSKQKDGTPAAPGATPAAPGAPAAPAPDLEAQAREEFARHDTDKNGSLSIEEMQSAGKSGSRIYDEREKWDTNKNGTIELPEYIEYYKARKAQGGPDASKPVEEEKRPTVYRTGKMPKELPAWFEAADTDKDGQVGLYEWKASGKSVREFMTMDQNGDGFLTVEEVLRFQRATVKAPDSPSVGSPTSSASPTGAATQGDKPRNRGDRNGGGKGKGGRPKGG